MLVEVIIIPFFVVRLLWFFGWFDDFPRIAANVPYIMLLASCSISRRLPRFASWIWIGVMAIVIQITMTLTHVLEQIIFPDF